MKRVLTSIAHAATNRQPPRSCTSGGGQWKAFRAARPSCDAPRICHMSVATQMDLCMCDNEQKSQLKKAILRFVRLRAKTIVQNVNVRIDRMPVNCTDGFLDQIKR